jgi:hypothetical protein
MNKTKNEGLTRTEYRAFQEAYDFFNKELFKGRLPQLLVTLQRRGNTKGYFSNKRFAGRANDKTVVHELALNPDTFSVRTDEEILSTLVHEQVHCWQFTFGNPSRGGYHNREWADKMIELGLRPTHDGTPDGRKTGQRVTHIIVKGGPYAVAYQKLKARGFQLHWQSAPPKKVSRNSKTKFSCPICGQNAWAKPEAQLICGVEAHENTEMQPVF